MEERGVFSDSLRKKARRGAISGEGLADAAPEDHNFGQATIISIVENRAREICICKVSTGNMASLEVYLVSDSHSYNETLSIIQSLEPDEILLHDGSRNKPLSDKISSEVFSDARILFISRQYFDQDRGAEMLKKILQGDVDADLVAKYIVLSGSYCLLRYIENCNGSSIAAHSMRVEFSNIAANRMNIDRKTASNLELVSNSKDGNQKESLFGAINRTKTVVGGRLLRGNLLKPIADMTTLQTRLDMVEFFLCNSAVFTDTVEQLKQFPDLDKMLTGLVTIPRSVTQKTAKIGIDTLIFLKQALKLAPILADILQHAPSEKQTSAVPDAFRASAATHAIAQSGKAGEEEQTSNPLLAAIVSNLRDPALGAVQELIAQHITESTTFAKSAYEMRHQECFAIRNGVHGLLDVARKTFQQTVEDMYQLAERYSLEFGATVKVTFNNSRGYYMLVPASLDPLPPVLTQAVLNKRTISCSSDEFSSLSDRAAASIGQALTITHELIQSLLAQIRSHIDVLFRLTDTVALLDMLSSFADIAAVSPNIWSRPVLVDDGPIVIKAGRHPVISTLPMQQLASSFVANDLFLSPLENLHVISGPNGSGKTVYIKQTALIVILAQVGCFVPARHATIPIRDRILSRIGTSDDMEHNMSTFTTEMKETAYILANITDRSLVVIDELGRGTSNIDGLSIAYSIAEALLSSRALTLFVTHYPQITSIAKHYANVKNVHLKTTIEVQSASEAGADQVSIKYLHEIGNGPCDMKSGYGIIMAEHCGFPQAVIDDARSLRRVIRDAYPLLLDYQDEVNQSVSVAHYARDLLQHLLLLKNSALSDSTICDYLQNLRDKVSEEAAEQLLKMIEERRGVE